MIENNVDDAKTNVFDNVRGGLVTRQGQKRERKSSFAIDFSGGRRRR